MDNAIVLDGVHKNYGKVLALRGIDLAISAGGITAILGPNGAGKTTLMNVLLGLANASSGKAHVLGHAPGSKFARLQIGAMLQDTELPELLTVKEHVDLFAAYYAAPRDVEETLEITGLARLARRPYAKLSGGQKRRVQFAAAIVGNPKLVFLDEPTTGLDPDARKTLWDVVDGLKKNGATILLTTHYLEEADALADRVLMIDQGKIVADGPIADIRAKVGGKRMSFIAELPADFLTGMAEIQSTSKTGRYTELLVSDPLPVLKRLLSTDISLEDLTISGTRLEDAFHVLTGKGLESVTKHEGEPA